MGAAEFRSPDHERVAGQWAGLVAKDVWQDALCSIWSEFCRAGVAACRSGAGGGLTWDQVRALGQGLTAGPPDLDGEVPCQGLASAIASGDVTLADFEKPVCEMSLEGLRAATDSIDTATSGLVVVLELHRRAAARADPGWLASSRVRSVWQPSLAEVISALTVHLSSDATVADTLWWIIHRFIVAVHERIAYSKLPEHTFRFRWEDGRVRFFDNGVGRFPLAAIRHESLALLTRDLGLWARDDEGDVVISGLGRAFVDASLP